MEDAHIACNDLSTLNEYQNGEKNAIFGVFDGHGGELRVLAICCHRLN